MNVTIITTEFIIKLLLFMCDFVVQSSATWRSRLRLSSSSSTAIT